MPRPLLALLLVGGAIALTAQQGVTGSNTVAESTAVYRATTVSGASLVALDFTTTSGTITAVAPRLRKTGLSLTTQVKARFGDGPAVACIAGVITVLDLVTSLAEATYDCGVFSERADRPRPLVITAT